MMMSCDNIQSIECEEQKMKQEDRRIYRTIIMKYLLITVSLIIVQINIIYGSFLRNTNHLLLLKQRNRLHESAKPNLMNKHSMQPSQLTISHQILPSSSASNNDHNLDRASPSTATFSLSTYDIFLWKEK